MGAVRRHDRLDAGAGPRGEDARKARGAATAVVDRGGEVQRAAHRRPPVRATQRHDRRQAATDQGHVAGAVPRDEAAEREQCSRHQEPVVHRDGRVRGASRGEVNGVVIAQGGRFGGWALYFKEGRAKFVYNLLGMQEFVTEATEAVTPGSHQVRVEFAYDGGGLGKGGTSPSTTTVAVSAAVGWNTPSRSSSRPTRPRTSATITECLSATTTPARAGSPGGCRSCRSTSARTTILISSIPPRSFGLLPPGNDALADDGLHRFPEPHRRGTAPPT